VAWSLGNFLFDQRAPGTDAGLMLKCHLTRRTVRSVEVIPIRIVKCQPRPATKAEREKDLADLQKLSPGIPGLAKTGTVKPGAD
jgi:poly-gamma-glutamate capsule biosynthesis protein CapA/YwtB (metallophosphatase superfamily)